MNVCFIVGKGGYIWVVARKEDGSYIQCLNCGNIYITERKVPISTSIVKSECPKCCYRKGLNCGDQEEDIAVFYDPYLDERYFNY